MNKNIALICDSGCDVPEELIASHNISVIPLTLNYKEGSLQSGIDITTDEVVERFAEEIPSTSLPSPSTIKKTFEAVRDAGYTKAIFIGISSALSATYNTAAMLADQIEGIEIVTIDTKNISIACALIVRAATQMIDEGIPFEQLKGKLEALASKTYIFFAVETLTYLHKGGRISEATYRLGTALNIKPLITCDENGAYATAKKARGYDKALREEVNLVAKRMKGYSEVICGICCCKKYDESDHMQEMLEAKIDTLKTVVRTTISAALVVHTGPQIVGVACQPDWHTL